MDLGGSETGNAGDSQLQVTAVELPVAVHHFVFLERNGKAIMVYVFPQRCLSKSPMLDEMDDRASAKTGGRVTGCSKITVSTVSLVV